MRASLLLDSDPAAAARRASIILEGSPGHPEATLLFAAASRKLADPEAATQALESLANAHRDTPLMQLEVGRAYAASGRRPEALAAFRRAVALDQGLADAWRELAAVYFETGETLEGDAAYLKYRRLTRDPPELTDAIVALCGQSSGGGRGCTASPAGSGAARRGGAAPAGGCGGPARRPCGGGAAAHRVPRTRAGFCRRPLTIWRNCFKHSIGAPKRCRLVERLLAVDPRNIDYLSLKAQALRLTGRNEEAIALMQQALADHPDEDKAWLLCGHLLREVGQQARAIEMYRKALVVRPQSGRAYASLANLKTFRFTAEDLTAMREQLAQGTTRGGDRTNLEFALGKALEDQGDFAASFEHYARGNALHRATVGHDAEAVTADVQRSKAFYTPRFFAERAEWGSGRTDPIFIVGLPRSGSTLLEQILASHSLSRRHARADGRPCPRRGAPHSFESGRSLGFSGIPRSARQASARGIRRALPDEDAGAPAARQAALR